MTVDPLAGLASGPRQPFTAAEWTSNDPDRPALFVTTQAPGLLVVADTWMPGWTATVDGRPAPVLRGNYAQRVDRALRARPARHRHGIPCARARPRMCDLPHLRGGLVADRRPAAVASPLGRLATGRSVRTVFRTANPYDAAPDLPRSRRKDDRVRTATAGGPGCHAVSGRAGESGTGMHRCDRPARAKSEGRSGPGRGATNGTRRLPVGAEVIPSGGVTSGSGRRSRRRWRSCCKPARAPARAVRLADEGQRLLHWPGARGRRRDPVRLPARRATARSCPIRPRDTSPRGRTGRRRWSIRRPCAGPTRLARRRRRSRARCSTSCTSARSRPKGPGPPPASSSRTWRPRRHGARGHAGRRVPRPFGWGYDGVDLFAPFHGYGTPDDFRRFVDRAHAAGPGGDPRRRVQPPRPGRQLPQASSPTSYFSKRHKTEWGEALNFDGPGCGPVREFVLANAGYWIDEFHLDGLRLDAHAGHLRRPARPHPGGDRAGGSREAAGGRRRAGRRRERAAACPAAPRRPSGAARLRHALERRLPPRGDGRRHRPPRGVLRRLPRHAAGARLGAQARLALPGPVEPPAGQAARHAGARTSRRAAFINYLQNHDQVANSARGERLHRADDARPATAP